MKNILIPMVFFWYNKTRLAEYISFYSIMGQNIRFCSRYNNKQEYSSIVYSFVIILCY